MLHMYCAQHSTSQTMLRRSIEIECAAARQKCVPNLKKCFDLLSGGLAGVCGIFKKLFEMEFD